MRRLVVAAVLAAALGGGDAAGAARDARVTVRLFQFQPAEMAVAAGTPIVWRNADDISHTVTAGTPEHRGGAFHLVMDGAGSTVTLTPAAPGTYPYFCERHPHMRGVIRVP
jgi:plastocyanin